MKWKFWQKAAAHTEVTPSWPEDAVESIRLLTGMFLLPGPPFNEWKTPLVELSPAIDTSTRIAVKGYQTWRYFHLLAHRIGTLEAEIVEGAFFDFLVRAHDDPEIKEGARNTRRLLKLIDESIVFAEEQDKKVITTPSGDVAVPLEYFMALHLLMRLPNSPYYDRQSEPDIDFNGDDWALTDCLAYGIDEAQRVFGPMVKAISSFEVDALSAWIWRDAPGAYERQLQRRHNNLLFPNERRTVTTADVLDARRKDAADYKALVDECKALDLPEDLPSDWQAVLQRAREDIDRIKKRAHQLGGDTSKVMTYLNNQRRHLGDAWRGCMQNHPEAIRLYEAAEERARELDNFVSHDFISQMTRDDATIPASEVVPSLLCEDGETVAAFWAIQSPEARQKITLWVGQVLMAAVKQGYDLSSLSAQLVAMDWNPPPVPA